MTRESVISLNLIRVWCVTYLSEMFQIVTSPLLRQYLLIITVNLSILCVGMDLGWTSPVLVKLRNPEQTPLSRPLTTNEEGWLVSIGFIFSIFILPCIGGLTDCIGRKNTLLAVCCPKIVAGLLATFASEVWMLLLVRVINGLTNTASMLVLMIYSTEIASKEIRGSLGSLVPMFSSLGVFAMLGLGPYLSYLTLSIMFTVITTCASIPLFFIPDTPYSLYRKGKIEDAENVLIFFRGSKALAQEEMKEFSQFKPNQKLNKKEIFKNKAYLKALIIVVVMGIGVQVVGFNCISFYLQTILELTEANISSAVGSLVIGFIQIVTSIFTCLISDRFGRRPILISTLFGMAVGMMSLGLFFVLKQYGVIIAGVLNYVPLVSIAIVTGCYGGGIGSQYFVLITELLDGPIRVLGTTASFVITTVAVFFLSKYTLNVIAAVGAAATFISLGVACLLMTLFVLFFIPETKKKTIAEIQLALGGATIEEVKSAV